ncbi:hypothetical protein SeLEV6574_g02814 [Synchytrium endobioticum]|uniref:DNA primase small subunit n=1 Tax=Synchytrium endobioticum TaxID=286115 RepID=A0A507D744_9FUNG|nr:hypothetical protein SeLEV6574_g02814 [Synchytrium endobioticum]
MDKWNHAFSSHVPYTQRDSKRAVPPGNSKSSLHYPYKLTISRLEGLTLPPILTETYINSASDAPLSCHIRATFFDVNSAGFYGRTWTSPKKIHIRTPAKSNIDTKDADDAEEQDSESEKSFDQSKVYSADVSLVGNRLTATLHDVQICFHTPVTNPEVIIVLEFVLQVVNGVEANPHRQNIGFGWTFLHPFDPMKNGLDSSEAWSEVAKSEETPAKLIPIYIGTPRMLPVIAPLLLGQMLGFPALTPIPSALCTYKLQTCPSIRPVCHYLRENEFVGDGDLVPGCRFTADGASPMETSPASFSQISVNLQPSIQQFEDYLVKSVAKTYCDTLQIPPSDPLAPPTILERRLNIGFHNGRTFLNTPTTITLTPVINTDDTSGTELRFSGNVELDSYVPDDDNVVVVFTVEDKVNVVRSMPTNEEDANVRGRRLSTRAFEKSGVEQVVFLGWTIWKPSSQGHAAISLVLSNSIQPNPFVSSMYLSDNSLVGTPPILLSCVFTGPPAPSSAPSRSRAVSYIEKPKSLRARSIPPSPEKPVPITPIQQTIPPSTVITETLVPAMAINEQDSLKEPSPGPIIEIVESSTLKSKLTRAEKARLASAGFIAVLDSEGRKPSVLSLEDVEATPNIALELQDTKLNEVSLCLLGLSLADNVSLNKVFFTFKFWTYPEVKTSPVLVYTGILPPDTTGRAMHERAKSNMMWPGILYDHQDGITPAYCHAPGVSFTYSGDDVSPKQLASRYAATTFRHYMASKVLQIFVWDGESHLCLGNCDVELKPALRRGKNAITFDDSVALVTMNPTQDLNTPNRIGSLFLRWTNISRKGKVPSTTLPKPTVYDYHEAIKVHPETKHMGSRMQDTDPELSEILKRAHSTSRTKTAVSSRAAKNETNAASAQIDRKLAKARRVLAHSDANNVKRDVSNECDEAFQTYQLSSQERQRDMQTIEIFRERKKRVAIVEALSKHVTTCHTVYPSLGLLCYFEFIFANPYNYDAKFDISFDDAELRIISNAAMLKYLRRIHRVMSPLEKEEIFSAKPDGSTEMFLLANEKMSIPFIFQTFCQTQARVTTVSFFNNEQKPVALLDVRVIPTGHFVERVIRFFRPENEIFKSVLRLESPSPSGPFAPILPDGVTTLYDASQSDARYIRCGDGNLSCQLVPTMVPNIHDITFKSSIQAASLGAKTLNLLLYDDPFCSSLVCIWSVLLHSLYRFDVQCNFGQEIKTQLIVRGASGSRTCHLHSSSPEVEHSTGVMALPAQVLSEVPLTIRASTFGVKEVLVNLVDRNYLVGSYLLVLHVKPPAVTKTFGLSLSRSQTVNKRVTYTNPYQNKRRFIVSSNNQQVLSFQERILDLNKGETGYIRLHFTPNDSTASSIEALTKCCSYAVLHDTLLATALITQSADDVWSRAGFDGWKDPEAHERGSVTDVATDQPSDARVYITPLTNYTGLTRSRLVMTSQSRPDDSLTTADNQDQMIIDDATKQATPPAVLSSSTSSPSIPAKRKSHDADADFRAGEPFGDENKEPSSYSLMRSKSSGGMAGGAKESLDAGFSTLIKVFYQRVFPVSEFYKWLSYGNVAKNYFPNREISYAYENDVVVRHLSFADAAELKADLVKNSPAKIDIGPVYNIRPKDKKTVRSNAFQALERELVFDIDMTDYDEIRICCRGADICHKCWDFMTISIKIIDRAIRENFGFKHRLWVYSGRRGVHCWICDERARRLNAELRTAIVKHIEVIKGGEQMLKKVSLGMGALHPTLVPAMKILEEYFPKTCLVNQDILGTPERWNKILKMLNDEELRKDLDEHWQKTLKLSSKDKWEQMLNELETRKSKKVAMAFRRDVIFQYLYPRLDDKVSTGVNHLLKSPFCIHPKTGRVCVPIVPEQCESFDPLTVPTLVTLVEELNQLPSSQNDSSSRKTVPPSFLPHLEHFRSFIKGMEDEIRTKLRAKRIEEDKKLIF